MQPNIEVLGAQIVNEMMAAERVGAEGFTPQFGINAAAELLNRGVATYQNQEAAKKSAAEQAVALDAALTADINWANAEVMTEQANASKDPAKIMAAQSLASSAMSNAMNLGAKLNADSSAKRVAQANKMANEAAQRAFADSKNVGLQAAMRAWQKVAGAASQATMQMPGGGDALQRYGAGGGSFLDAMKKKYAGVPLGGWLVGIPLGGTLLYMMFKALRRK